MDPKKLIVIFLCLLSGSTSLKILGLFPHPGLSHFHFFHPIMRGLAYAGHDVTVVSHFPDQSRPTNYRDLKLTETDLLTNSINLEMFEQRTSFSRMYQHYLEFFLLQEWGMDACELALNSTAIKKILKDGKKYDVILLEQFNSDCMMPVAWKLNAPTIALSSCDLMPWLYDRFGNPFLLSHVPGIFTGYSDKMSFLERLNNWISVNIIKLLYQYSTLPQTEILVKKFINDENMPKISELIKDTSMMFVNSHHSFTGSRAKTPNILELGGIHIKESRQLDPELKAILDSAKNGVIYVSWGSMIRADTFPVEKRTSLLKTFGTLKQKVLWKWENDTIPDQPENVFIRKWMPQKEVLCHPNVRVFLSHGGLMGTSESVHCGVPMVLTPMYGDQFHNAAAAKSRGIGFIVHYEDITESSIRKAINNALKQQSLENAKQVSYSFKHREAKPIDSAIWWVEYVAKTNGAPLLKSHSVNMSTFAYYSFDIYVTIALFILVIIISWIYMIYSVIKKLITKKPKIE